MSMNVAAAGKCRGNATDWDEYVRFLDMLGIRNGDRIAPDPEPSRLEMPLPKAQVSVVSQQAASQDIRLRPKHSTAPEALRNLPPVINPGKPVKPKTPRSPLQLAGPPQDKNNATKAPCGTKAATKRHRRNGEVNADGTLACAPCEASRLERAKRNPAFNPAANPMLGKVAECGDLAGYQRHRRANPGKPVTCQSCVDGYNAYRRARRAEKGRAA